MSRHWKVSTKLKEVVSSKIKIGYAMHLRRDVRSLRNETWREGVVQDRPSVR